MTSRREKKRCIYTTRNGPKRAGRLITAEEKATRKQANTEKYYIVNVVQLQSVIRKDKVFAWFSVVLSRCCCRSRRAKCCHFDFKFLSNKIGLREATQMLCRMRTWLHLFRIRRLLIKSLDLDVSPRCVSHVEKKSTLRLSKNPKTKQNQKKTF